MNSYRFSLALLLSGVLCVSALQAKCPRDNRITSAPATAAQANPADQDDATRWFSVLSNERIEELLKDIRSIRQELGNDLSQLRHISSLRDVVTSVRDTVRTMREEDMSNIMQILDKLNIFFESTNRESIFDRILDRIEETLQCCNENNIAQCCDDILDALEELETQLTAMHNDLIDRLNTLQSMIGALQVEVGVIHDDTNDIQADLNAMAAVINNILANQAAGGVILNNIVTALNTVLANQAAGGVILNNIIAALNALQVTVDDIQETVDLLEDLIIVS